MACMIHEVVSGLVSVNEYYRLKRNLTEKVY
jgi:hypothetical protein